jgi:hypothetical protein
VGFDLLNGIVADREFNSSNEVEMVIAGICNGLTFDDMQSIPRTRMNPLTWVVEKMGATFRNKREPVCSSLTNVEIGVGTRTFSPRYIECPPQV